MKNLIFTFLFLVFFANGILSQNNIIGTVWSIDNAGKNLIYLVGKDIFIVMDPENGVIYKGYEKRTWTYLDKKIIFNNSGTILTGELDKSGNNISGIGMNKYTGETWEWNGKKIE
tara:strand:+ start:4679 stop:5023 length:345 start_codon:yes stop_codon:yes gene_type:complete